MARIRYKPRLYFPAYWKDSSLKKRRKEAIERIKSGEVENDEEIEELKKIIKKVESDLRKRKKYRKLYPYRRHGQYRKNPEDIDDMVESLSERLENPEFISTDERALELINEALEHLGEAYDLLEVDFEGDDPCMIALAIGMEKVDESRFYFGVDDD